MKVRQICSKEEHRKLKIGIITIPAKTPREVLRITIYVTYLEFLVMLFFTFLVVLDGDQRPE
jgi:hypothetical protein